MQKGFKQSTTPSVVDDVVGQWLGWLGGLGSAIEGRRPTIFWSGFRGLSESRRPLMGGGLLVTWLPLNAKGLLLAGLNKQWLAYSSCWAGAWLLEVVGITRGRNYKGAKGFGLRTTVAWLSARYKSASMVNGRWANDRGRGSEMKDKDRGSHDLAKLNNSHFCDSEQKHKCISDFLLNCPIQEFSTHAQTIIV